MASTTHEKLILLAAALATGCGGEVVDASGDSGTAGFGARGAGNSGGLATGGGGGAAGRGIDSGRMPGGGAGAADSGESHGGHALSCDSSSDCAEMCGSILRPECRDSECNCAGASCDPREHPSPPCPEGLRCASTFHVTGFGRGGLWCKPIVGSRGSSDRGVGESCDHDVQCSLTLTCRMGTCERVCLRSSPAPDCDCVTIDEGWSVAQAPWGSCQQ